MRIAIVGAGAMGSVYAGNLGAAGNEVWAIDTWAEHVAAIRRHGLHVEGASGERTVRIHATGDPAEAGPCELVVIATKAQDVEVAARSVAPLIGADTVVVPIQNGLGSADRVAAVLGEERVAIGVAGGFGASLVGPGHVRHEGWELLRLGERRGPATERIRRIARVWEDAGFRVRVYDDVDQLVWEKLLCNAAYSAVCAVLGWTIGEVIADPDAWSVAAGCAREVHAVARARGIHLDVDDPEAYVRRYGEAIPDARPSLLLDLLAGRPSEVDVINGAIGPAARAVGLEAPVNDLVSALVRARSGRA